MDICKKFLEEYNEFKEYEELSKDKNIITIYDPANDPTETVSKGSFTNGIFHTDNSYGSRHYSCLNNLFCGRC